MYASANQDCTGCDNHAGGLEYVGGGRGEYIMEPQLKYVGYGGDIGVRRRRDCSCILIPSGLLCCLLLTSLLLWALWPTSEECLVDKEEFAYKWSPVKIQQCCRRGFVPCPKEEVIIEPSTTPLPYEGPVDPFNCADGFLNWKSEWSIAKKQYCCTHHRQGCGADAEVPAAQYDCSSALANWVKAWSEGKKTWCCARGTKSCPNDAAFAGAGYGAGTHHGLLPNGAPIAR
jgi:hypothetical protein